MGKHSSKSTIPIIELFIDSSWFVIQNIIYLFGFFFIIPCNFRLLTSHVTIKVNIRYYRYQNYMWFIRTTFIVLTMVLKIESDRPRLPASHNFYHGFSQIWPIGLESNRIRIGPLELKVRPRTRWTDRFPSNRPIQPFFIFSQHLIFLLPPPHD